MKLIISIIVLILLLIYFLKKKNVERFSIKQIPIYCINLKKAKERWDKVQNEFNKFNLKIQRIEAVNGSKVNMNNITDKTKLEYNTNLNSQCDKNIKPGITLQLSKGEIGCSLSHLSIWEKILDENIDKCIIIEDDIKLNSNFKEYEDYMKKVPADWDIIYISFLNTGKKEFVGKNIYIPTCGFSTSGYIISFRGAKKILKFIPIEGSVDIFLLNLFKNKKINAYVIEGLCDASNTWGGNDSQIEHSTRNLKKFKI